MDDTGKAYWSAVLGLLTKVLVIWFVVSFGAGILDVAGLLNASLPTAGSLLQEKPA